MERLCLLEPSLHSRKSASQGSLAFHTDADDPATPQGIDRIKRLGRGIELRFGRFRNCVDVEQHSGACAKANSDIHIRSSLCVPNIKRNGIRPEATKDIMNRLEAGSTDDSDICSTDAFTAALQVTELCHFPRNVNKS
ncbi:hypothetical protein PsorP6_014642 [Peronosclerospora sorghi]|uniref:Uncharacterized protein n=1 Tax=Peronosclerospora sorghi TaxID=230839 RepID=A0ACC0VUQ7_9STRA|nr:hypothetical protein PsorP6_014642 [Peronosclerospora sorghi]